MAAMLTRTLELAVPSLAMAVVGFALFGPGATRSFDGAQIWGGPTEGARWLSWRVLGVERFRGIDSTKDLGGIVVRARAQNGAETVARCRTRRDGTCDVELALDVESHGAVHAEVTTEDGRTTLASGDFARDSAGWDRGPVHPRRLAGAARGDLALEVSARRGVFAAPFRDDLVASVKHGETPVRGARVSLRTDAALVAGAVDSEQRASRETTDRGEATFELEPRTHTVEVSLETEHAGLAGSWTGVLPVIPGAIWLDPTTHPPGRIHIVSPVLRDVVYATLSSRTLRIWGGTIALSSDEHGFAEGNADVPGSGKFDGPLWLTLASDPRASGSGTVGWPVTSAALADGELAFRDWLLLDGMPAAEQRDAKRRARARRLAFGALGAAAVIEGVLLARGSYGKGAKSFVWLAVAIATIALAFAAIGLVSMWKMG
jgi:hypothetical protein